jgi:hypothetical protein
MQRREGGRRFELRQDRIVDEAMLPKFRPAMDDAMPDRGRHRHFGVGEKLSDADDCFPLARNGTRLGEQCISARVFCMEFAAFVADRLGLAGEQHFDP